MRQRRVLKTRYFRRWAHAAGLTDEALLKAVREMEQGLIDADLGGGVIKKRIGVVGRGKRGGARVDPSKHLRRDRMCCSAKVVAD